MTSPWAAPNAEPDIARAADAAERWVVRAAVLEPHHIARFESTFREHLERLEAALSPNRPQQKSTPDHNDPRGGGEA